MEWVRYELGGFVWSGTCAEPGVVFEAHGRKRLLASSGVYEVTGPVMPRFEGPFEPFRWQQRGNKRRLSWPLGSVEFRTTHRRWCGLALPPSSTAAR